MATLTIGGKRIKIDDSFKSLSPADQQKTVDEIAGQIGMGAAATQQANSPQGDMTINNVGRSVARGVPVVGGLLNRGNAAINATLAPVGNMFFAPMDQLQGDWTQRYGQSLAQQNEMDQSYADQHPVLNAAGELTGGVAGSVAMLPAPGAGGLVATSAKMAGTGAAVGGADAYTRNDFDPKAAASGAVGGFVFGAAGPTIAKGIGGTWNAIASRLASKGASSDTVASVINVLQRSGLTPQQAEAQLLQMGPDAMLADVAQLGAAGTARANTEAGTMMGQRLAQRREMAPQRIKSELDQTFGPFEDPFAVRQEIKGAKAAINPEYAAAIKANQTLLPKSLAEMDPALADVSNMSAGNRAAMSGHVANIDDALSAPTPQMQAARLLDLRQHLDSQIVYDGRAYSLLSPAEKASQGVTNQARRVVDGLLKKNVPGIAEADELHAPLSRQQSAFDYGRRQMLSGGNSAITPAENQSRLLQMTDPERLATAQGVRATVEQTLTNPRGDASAKVDRLLNRDWNDRKLNSLTGEKAGKRLADAINREQSFTETSNLIEPGRGSRTSDVLSARDDLWGKTIGTKPGLVSDAVTGGLTGGALGGPHGAAVGVATSVVARAKSALVDAIMSKSPEIIKKTADALTQTGEARDTLVAAMMKQAQKGGQIKATSRGVELLARTVLNSLVPSETKALASGLSPRGR